MLRRKLRGLLDSYPMLQLITGDAIFAQRPLIKLIRSLGKDYLFQVKGNQKDTLNALEHCFAKQRSVLRRHRWMKKGASTGTPSFMAGFR